MDRVTPARTALRRRETFSSYQEAFDQLRKRSFFRKFSDEVLSDYVSNGFIYKTYSWSRSNDRVREGSF